MSENNGEQRVEQGATDGAGFEDSVTASVVDEGGQEKQRVGPHDPYEYPNAPGVPVPTGEAIEHPKFGRIEGPSTEEGHWVDRDEMLENDPNYTPPPQPLGIGEIRNEGSEDEVQGPSERWAQHMENVEVHNPDLDEEPDEGGNNG